MIALVREKINQKLDDIRRRGLVTTSRKFLRDHLYSHRRHVFLDRDLSKPFNSFAQKGNWTPRMLKGGQELDKFRLHFASSINGIADLFDRGCIAFGRAYEELGNLLMGDSIPCREPSCSR